MTEWYLPITILPGVGLLVLSTSNIGLNLSSEIASLIKEDCSANESLIEKKIDQMTKLSRALVCLYLSAASLVLSGILKASTLFAPAISEGLLVLGAVFLLVALSFLLRYSIKAVRIRRQQFTDRLSR